MPSWLIHTGTYCKKAHTWSAAREQEIFESFKGRHLVALSLLSFTYPSILSSLLSVLSFENECASTGAVASVQPQKKKSCELDAFEPLICENNTELPVVHTAVKYKWFSTLAIDLFCVCVCLSQSHHYME